MNFTESIKKEIISKPPKDLHCKKAFLSGIIRGTGVLYEREGEFGIEFRVSSEEIAMQVSSLIKNIFDFDVREVEYKNDHLNNKEQFILNVFGEKAIDVLTGLEILSVSKDGVIVNYDYYGKLTEMECCFKSFIKGLFLSSGMCSVPNEKSKTGYRLELPFSHSKTVLQTADCLLEYGIISHISRRKELFILYIKSAEIIKDFLAFLPTPVSVIKLSDIIVNREFNNRINRQKNCDLKNVDRQVDASIKQIEAIEKIQNNIGIESLKEDLKIVAIARKENPDFTLVELADKLEITKSCLNHRLRKLVEISNGL
ncbi:MAG: DNA-binding protein WhiA [Clostridia bacterium]|nr:DNA-binding protein WhiA [Clostridia bacterium]